MLLIPRYRGHVNSLIMQPVEVEHCYFRSILRFINFYQCGGMPGLRSCGNCCTV